MSYDLLTQEEVAEMLKVTIHAVRKWRRRGLLPYILIGNTVRIERTALEAFIDAHRSPDAPAAATG
jgi:excisionase family DNA binding protein